MKLEFTKMHGCGNDYIYFNCFTQAVPNPQEISVSLSHRHFGIGGDGIVLILPSTAADARMRMFNLDGSEGLMCGNAIRCVGKYLYDNGLVNKDTITVETASGIKTLQLHVQENLVDSVTVNMGRAVLTPAEIPVALEGEQVVDCPLQVDDAIYHITCVSMGNPHCVVFGDDPDKLRLEELGPRFESHPIFPQRINTEFIQVRGSTLLKMRVWERGSGETWACGTGACGAVVAAVLNGHCQKDSDVTVQLKGGDLVIRYTDEVVWMTGKATKVFDGTVDV